MKSLKGIVLILFMLLSLMLISCDASNKYKKVDKMDPTCFESGYIEHYINKKTGEYFSDEKGEDKIGLKDILIRELDHDYDYKGTCIICKKNNIMAAIYNEESKKATINIKDAYYKLGDVLSLYVKLPNDSMEYAIIGFYPYLEKNDISKSLRGYMSFIPYNLEGNELLDIKGNYIVVIQKNDRFELFIKCVITKEIVGDIDISFDVKGIDWDELTYMDF